MGYLAEQDNFDAPTLKKAMAYGILVASYNVEDFSLERMKQLSRADIDARFDEFRAMLDVG